MQTVPTPAKDLIPGDRVEVRGKLHRVASAELHRRDRRIVQVRLDGRVSPLSLRSTRKVPTVPAVRHPSGQVPPSPEARALARDLRRTADQLERQLA